MSLDKLADALIAMSDRLSALEDLTDSIDSRTKQLLEYVGEPQGELSYRVRHRPRPIDLKRQFESDATLEEECAEMGATFSYAMYLGLVPENGDKIRELLAPAQIKHLISALECYKKLNEIKEWGEQVRQRNAEDLESMQEEIRRSIELKILSGSNNVVDQLHNAQTALKQQEDRVTKALGQLEKALKASEDATARAKNVVVSEGSPKRQRFSLGHN